MEMSGERRIEAPRAAVWDALNDPEVLKASIPGCEEIEKVDDTHMTAKVIQKVGPVRATFTGEVELSDIVEGESYTISGKGKGGAAGGASGGAKVRLEEDGDATVLHYDVEAKVTGKIAQLGARLINGFAKKMADDFFDRFKARVEGGDEEDGEIDRSDQDSIPDPAPVSDAEGPAGKPTGTVEASGGAGEGMGDVGSKPGDTEALQPQEPLASPEPVEPEKKKGFWGRLFKG